MHSRWVKRRLCLCVACSQRTIPPYVRLNYAVVRNLMNADCEGMRVLIWREGMYMNNLAGMYSALGRHADALAMQERVLDLRRRFLPDNDPEIGDHDVHSDRFCTSAHSL